MKETHSFLYEAFKAKDTRFDGRFFVGISSTKIYCRPVCHARQAKAENCTFFSSAAEAEQAGYRPCLLCRPELAPGSSIVDASPALAKKAARLMEENCGSGLSVEAFAARLGCTDRHLRRVFENEFHVTPVQYLQTCRLLLAKNLLTDTNLSVLDVAMASGFGSLRRLNDLFKKQYGLSPTALRKSAADGDRHTHEVKIALGYRPPYQWDRMLDFLAVRAIPGVEKVENGTYMRTVQINGRDKKRHIGILTVKQGTKKDTLSVKISDTLIPVLSQVLAKVRHLFDLYCDPDTVYDTLQSMNEIRSGLCIRGTRVPGCFDSFEMAVRAILGQQITVKAASTLAGKIVQVYGKPIETETASLAYTFPTAEDIIMLEDNITECFGVLGVIASRSNSILTLARELTNGNIKLDQCANPQEEMRKLLEIKGIGSWTAKYIAMRTMGWTDAFLETDIGIKHALPNFTPKERLKLSEKWQPWRSYATVNLWNTL